MPALWSRETRGESGPRLPEHAKDNKKIFTTTVSIFQGREETVYPFLTDAPRTHEARLHVVVKGQSFRFVVLGSSPNTNFLSIVLTFDCIGCNESVWIHSSSSFEGMILWKHADRDPATAVNGSKIWRRRKGIPEKVGGSWGSPPSLSRWTRSFSGSAPCRPDGKLLLRFFFFFARCSPHLAKARHLVCILSSSVEFALKS